MAKSLRLRFCRAISTTVHSCRSKDPSVQPVDSVSGGSRRSFAVAVSRKFNWLKDDEWRVFSKIFRHPTPHRKIDTSSEDFRSFHFPPGTPDGGRKTRSESDKKKKRANAKSNVKRLRLHVSSASPDGGWFRLSSYYDGGHAEEEIETLVSSSFNFPTYSSFDFNPNSHLHPYHRRKTRKLYTRRQLSNTASESDTQARLSMFKKLLPCPLNAKVKESFAVVKRSSDPYEDFKNSMIDMIVEKQIFNARDLEQLLQCFLSLNCRNFHGIIFQAFTDIMENFTPPAYRRLDLPSAADGGAFHHLIV